MDSPDLNAMLTTASELAMESRWREAVELAQKIVAVAPSHYQTWWLLGQAHEKLGRKSDSVHAYAQYYRHAPRRAELRAMREFAAREAGVAFEEAAPADEDESQPIEMFTTTIRGEDALVQVRNDSGKPLDVVIEAAEALAGSANPFEAWLHLRKHRELLTSVADTVLSAMAQAQEDVRARTGVERYREAVRRVRQGETFAPFAEMANISESDFAAFVTAGEDLQPIVQQLAEAPSDAARAAIVKRHPEVVSDERTLTFLRILGGLQPNEAGRGLIQEIFTFIRRARRGAVQADARPEPPRVQRASGQTAAALGGLNGSDLGAIDAALAEWDAIARERSAVSPSIVALNRGLLLLARAEHGGDAGALDLACSTLAEGVEAETDPDSPMLVYHYGIALLRRFEHRSDAADLDEGIAAMRRVLSLVVDGTQIEGAARSMLGTMLMRRAEATGDLEDLNDSIAAHRLAITADAEPSRLAGRLANLATACVERFEISGVVGDLDEADQFYREALTNDRSQTTALGGLARVYRARYRVTDEPTWLDRAIDTYRAVLAAERTLFGRALAHNNLSSALRDRYLTRGDRADLDAAIEASRQAIGALPARHSQRAVWLENLGNHLRARAADTGRGEDRQAAIAALEEAMALASEGSDVWRTSPANLGALLEAAGDVDRGLQLLELAFARATDGVANLGSIEAAQTLARAHARRGNWARGGEVALAGLDRLERLQRVQLSAAAKKGWLAKAGELHVLAAELLLRAGRVNDALVAIERGRGRLLAEALDRDRAALAKLEQTGQYRLVQRYRTAAEHVRGLAAAAERGRDVRSALVAAMQELDAAIAFARDATNGLAFGLPPAVDAIIGAAKGANAPLVYLVPLSKSGVAIVVSGSADVRAIDLPALTDGGVNAVVDKYIAAYAAVAAQADERTFDEWKIVLDTVVRWSWDACMRVLDRELGDAREVVLIPVGRLGRLPLHAASGDEAHVREAKVWRYAPSARILSDLVATDADALLTVEYADQDAPLPFAAVETTAARAAFANQRALRSETATVTAVLNEARHATAIHFACHAAAPGDNALGGGLRLADGVLSLQELLDLQLAKGTIVLLSACETGVIGEKLPDEVLSIGSAMLQAGASAVVSSLWKVPDVSTAILMSRFYAAWRNEGRTPAAALLLAQAWMRDSSNGEVAAFLRANLDPGLVGRLADALESDPSGSEFGHSVHWAAFTYAGR